MVLSGLKCNLNEWTSTSYSCDTHLSWTGAWFISALWRSVWAQAVTCHPYGCAPRFLEPRPGRWLSYCHLAADMTCATSHATELLRCHTTWSPVLVEGCASCSCHGEDEAVPGNSCWLFLPAPPGAAARMDWDGLGRARELSLLEEVVQLWGCLGEICLTRRGKRDWKRGCKTPEAFARAAAGWREQRSHSLFLPARNERSVLLWNLIARSPTLPWSRLLLSHALWSGYIYIWGEKSGFEWIVITVITATACFLWEFLMCALSSHNLIEFIHIFKRKPLVQLSHTKCLRK